MINRYPCLSACVLLASIIMCFSQKVTAQDIHYSQFLNSPLTVNPALNGLYKGDIRMAFNYRSQWSKVPVDYRTVTGAFEMKFAPKANQKGFFAIGLGFNNDVAGFGDMTQNEIQLNTAYTQRLSKRFYATVGLQTAFNHRRLELNSDLSFGDQFVDGQFRPGIPTGDISINDLRNNNYFDISTGFNIRYQTLEVQGPVDKYDNRTKIDFGIGLFHLGQPNHSFVIDSEVKLPVRMNMYALAEIQVDKGDFDIVGGFSMQMQGRYRMTLIMTHLRYHILTDVSRHLAIQAGVTQRFYGNYDALVPGIEAIYNNWRVGLNWDTTLSGFRDAFRGANGGFELSVQYLIARPKLAGAFKLCPII